MTDNVIKSLKWLIFNFPKVENPKDESDKICNCINLYCTNAAEQLSRQQAEIERLNAVSEICGDCHRQYAEKIEQAKTEAIKEFAERVKECRVIQTAKLFASVIPITISLAVTVTALS